MGIKEPKPHLWAHGHHLLGKQMWWAQKLFVRLTNLVEPQGATMKKSI